VGNEAVICKKAAGLKLNDPRDAGDVKIIRDALKQVYVDYDANTDLLSIMNVLSLTSEQYKDLSKCSFGELKTAASSGVAAASGRDTK